VTRVTVASATIMYCLPMLRLRAAARFVAALPPMLGACRTTPRQTCYPERGAEVWVETHYPAATSMADPTAALTSLRVTPTSSQPREPGGIIAGRQARVWIVGPAAAARPDTIVSGPTNPDGYVGLPPKARTLQPGSYRVRVRDIGWVDAVRDVRLGPGERMALEIETREAASCLGPVIQTSAEPSSRPAA